MLLSYFLLTQCFFRSALCRASPPLWIYSAKSCSTRATSFCVRHRSTMYGFSFALSNFNFSLKRFLNSFGERGLVHVQMVQSMTAEGMGMELTVENFQRAYEEAQENMVSVCLCQDFIQTFPSFPGQSARHYPGEPAEPKWFVLRLILSYFTASI